MDTLNTSRRAQNHRKIKKTGYGTGENKRRFDTWQRLLSKGRKDLHGSGHPGVLIDTVQHGCEMLNVLICISIIHFLCFVSASREKSFISCANIEHFGRAKFSSLNMHF